MDILQQRLNLFITCLVIFFVFIPVARADEYLVRGDYGTAVRKLQQDLKKLGYFDLPVTGYFGPLTEASVRRLQSDHCLKTDGIVGPVTRGLINRLLTTPTPFVIPRTVMGYYTGAEGALPSSAISLASYGELLTCISLFGYQLNSKGMGGLTLAENLSEEEIRRVISTAKRKKIKALVLVHNMLYGDGSDGREVAHQILSDQQRCRGLVTDIFNLIRDNGFDGVDIDIEYLYQKDKELFNEFMAELSARLRPAGYYISVTLPPKTNGDLPGWGNAFDYATIARYADQVVIMAYDEHNAGSDPGPIASLPWVEEVLDHALTMIPAQKLILGVPAYGFDWNHDQPSHRYLSYSLAIKIAQRYNRPISWDLRGQVPYFTYIDENGSRHQVYFENASSWAGKLDLVSKYNIKGIAIWRLGMEDLEGWPVLESKFKVKKCN